MDPAIVSALSAILGSIVGGSATIATAWVTQRVQGQRELVSAEIRKRELLYTKFISECSKLAVDSLDHALDRPETLLQVYALQNRIRLTASDAVIVAATQTINLILKQYFERNITIEELRELAHPNNSDNDPLKVFSEACRNELQQIQLAA
jgi:hypothetical protein